MLRPSTLIALSLLSAVPALSSAQSGPYLGVAAGRAHTWLYTPHLTSRIQVNSGALGMKLFAGYRFNRYLASEFEYLNLGVFRADGRNLDLRMRVDGLGLSAMAMLPVTQQAMFFAKAGAFAKRLRVDSNYRYVYSGYVRNYTENHVHVVPLLGIGAEYRFAQSLALRMEYQHIGRSGLGETKFPKTDSSLLSAGLRYDF
jgi:OOP family OmpA-OmpF porin